MNGTQLTAELRRQGYSTRELAALTSSGGLAKVRRGAYCRGEEADLRTNHRRLIEATVRQCSSDVVVSYGSAAVLHGLPIWTRQLDRVHLTQDGREHGKVRRYVWLHAQPLAESEVTMVDGIRTTTLARTMLDVSCRLTLDRGVAVGDAALRRGLDLDDLSAALAAAPGRVGIGRARRAAALLDARSESVGESRSRVLFVEHGVPEPVLQWEVRTRGGSLIGRADFGWPAFRTIGEFDGKVKYGAAFLAPGRDMGDILFAEKRREDALRDLGLEVVRWVNADLDHPEDLLARLQRAFERGRKASRGR